MKKGANLLYVICVIMILFGPVCGMNVKENQVSEIDNEYLPEWPSIKSENDYQTAVEEYINKRIGGRETALFLYENSMAKVFNILEVGLYAYGEEGHIEGGFDDYVKDYQHLNLIESEELIDVLSDYMYWVNQYCEEKDIVFLTFIAPDKKTIYPEYVSKQINVYGETSRTDLLLHAFDEREVPYIFPKEVFLEEKKERRLYNKEYDILHWNDMGKLIASQEIDKFVRTNSSNIAPLLEKDYELLYEKKTKMDASVFCINEDVPVYSLVDDEEIINITKEDQFASANSGMLHYVNAKNNEAPIILIFRDSYFYDTEKYYANRYSHVIYVHHSDFDMIQACIDYYNPDIVLFEVVERMLDSFDFEKMKKYISR